MTRNEEFGRWRRNDKGCGAVMGTFECLLAWVWGASGVGYLVDFIRSGCNHLAIAEVADIAPFDRMVGGGFAFGGALSRRRYGSEPNAPVLRRKERDASRGSPGSFSDDNAVALG